MKARTLIVTWIAGVCACAAAVTPEGIASLVPAPYLLEEHDVQTSDGYILSVFRVSKDQAQPGNPLLDTKPQPGNPLPDTKDAKGLPSKLLLGAQGLHGKLQPGRKEEHLSNASRPAVLLQHGLLDSCAGFLLAGPGSALAFLLVDAGFDVWLANSRGSTQSRRHAWLPVDSPSYWAFSFDEMAQYDLPETLAYVRSSTGQERISYVSHSQGGTILLAAISLRPSLAQQLGVMLLMAPVATATHMTSIPLLTLSTLGTDKIFTLLGVREFLPSVKVISWMEGRLCTVRPDMCISMLAAICGYRRGAVDKERLPLYLQFTPAGSSVQNMAHWSQVVRGGATPGRPALTRFDWGTSCSAYGVPQMCNQDVYGTPDAPLYKLQDIDPAARIFIFSGGQDRLADPIDTELLMEALPGGVLMGNQIDPDLEHLDYIWGVGAPARIYKRIIAMLHAQGPVPDDPQVATN